MNAEEAAAFIAPKVGYSYPAERDRLFDILTLVNKGAWKAGSWQNFNANFKVKVQIGEDGQKYIIAPNTHDVLQKVNFNTEPRDIRDKWFEFHRNGLGGMDKGNWSDDFIDQGYSPVIMQPSKLKGPVKIAARSLDIEKDAYIHINGLDEDGNRVNTFEEAGVVGARLALSNEIRIIDNIHWSYITGISKSVSYNAVEVYLVDANEVMHLASRMEPEQQESNLRKYLVPHSCECNNVEGVFKRSKPSKIVLGTQMMLITDEESLLSMAISKDYLFYRKDPEKALPYIANGLKSLDDEKRESMVTRTGPIEVEGLDELNELEEDY